jgi:chromosome segregation ATPase
VTTPRDAETAQLVEDLFAEAHGLRMRYEDFSLYTERRIAELVGDRKAAERDRDRIQADLRLLHEQRDQLHAQLVDAVARAAAAEAMLETRTAQRDRARARVAALEASRAVRLAASLRRLTGSLRRLG